MWPPLLYSDLPYYIISTPTRPYTGDFGESHGDFGDFTYPNSSLPNPTTPNPTHPYPTISYLPLLDPTMVISVIPMVISVVISVFPATQKKAKRKLMTLYNYLFQHYKRTKEVCSKFGTLNIKSQQESPILKTYTILCITIFQGFSTTRVISQ